MTPVTLDIIVTAGGVTIDLDEPGWMTTYAEWFTVKALWRLRWKDGSKPPVGMLVSDGERGYYTARHVGIANTRTAELAETVAYGLGKVLADGTQIEVIRVFDDGMAVPGADAERIGLMLVRSHAIAQMAVHHPSG